MIEVQVKIHDRFSVEFKVGFFVKQKTEPNNFALNMWIFTPNSVDINNDTYSKSQFYRDLKSNVRLITPVFLLREIATGQSIPLKNLVSSFRNLADNPAKAAITEYEYEIKMFMAIFKSSARDEATHIMYNGNLSDIEDLVDDYILNIKNISSGYRRLSRIINVPVIPQDVYNYFLFGDEFMSNTIDRQTFRLLRSIEARQDGRYDKISKKLAELINFELHYRRDKGFPVVEADSSDYNRDVVFRQGILKKYIESDLFLQAQKKRDGVAMEQIYFSAAAGLSMIFATAIAFSFQQKYGNFTMPLFVALVISYMLKDRIKDTMRYYFAHRLKEKYFDNKTKISIKEDHIGQIKEGVDFISEEQVPKEVIEIRSRSPLLQAENRINDEKIILYRKIVKLESEMLREEGQYTIAGINDIMRLYLTSFIMKTDNAEVPLYTLDEEGNSTTIKGVKIYYLNIVIQMQHEEQCDYKRFRIVFNRKGILKIEEFN